MSRAGREDAVLGALAERLGALAPLPGERWIVACSGGPDSLALLCGASRVAPSMGVSLLAVYVDHGLRPEAAQEALFVAGVARELGVEARTVHVDVRGRAVRDRVSLMEAARLERYEALEGVASSLGATRILVGHTADDQVETVLMRLLRGAGPRGLRGMPERRGLIARPLLGVRRADIEAYLESEGRVPVRDPSNDDRRFLRPRLRHDVLPELRRRDPGIDHALLGLAEAAGRVANALDGLADAEASTGGEGFLVGRLRSVDPELRRVLLERGYRAVTGRGLCRNHVAAIERLLASSAGTRGIDLPGGIRAVRSYDCLRFERALHAGPPPAPALLPGPGKYEWEGWSFSVERVGLDDPSGPAGREARSVREDLRDEGWRRVHFVEEALVPPLVVRAFAPGDRIRPRGFGRSRKVSDVLCEARVPAHARAAWPLLCDGREVLLVPGFRPSEAARPREGAQRILRVTVEPPSAAAKGRAV